MYVVCTYLADVKISLGRLLPLTLSDVDSNHSNNKQIKPEYKLKMKILKIIALLNTTLPLHCVTKMFKSLIISTMCKKKSWKTKRQNVQRKYVIQAPLFCIQFIPIMIWTVIQGFVFFVHSGNSYWFRKSHCSHYFAVVFVVVDVV